MQTLGKFFVLVVLSIGHANALSLHSKAKTQEGQMAKTDMSAELAAELARIAKLEDAFPSVGAPGKDKDFFAWKYNIKGGELESCGQGRALTGFTFDGYCLEGTEAEMATMDTIAQYRSICIERQKSAGKNDFCTAIKDADPNCKKYWPCGYNSCSLDSAGQFVKDDCRAKYEKCPVKSFCLSPNTLEHWLKPTGDHTSAELCERVRPSINCASTSNLFSMSDHGVYGDLQASLVTRCLTKHCESRFYPEDEDFFVGVPEFDAAAAKAQAAGQRPQLGTQSAGGLPGTGGGETFSYQTSSGQTVYQVNGKDVGYQEYAQAQAAQDAGQWARDTAASWLGDFR